MEQIAVKGLTGRRFPPPCVVSEEPQTPASSVGWGRGCAYFNGVQGVSGGNQAHSSKPSRQEILDGADSRHGGEVKQQK